MVHRDKLVLHCGCKEASPCVMAREIIYAFFSLLIPSSFSARPFVKEQKIFG
jgi:hypothetical protein